MNPDLGATSGAAEPSSSLPPLLPVVVDDAVPRSNGAEILWPVDGNPKFAADHLCRALATKDKSAPPQNAARQLETYSQLYADTLARTPTPRLVKISYVVVLWGEPDPAVFVDKLLWDLNNSDAMIDVYAAKVAADFGLSSWKAARIGREMTSVVEETRKAFVDGAIGPCPFPSEETIVKAETRYPALVKGERAREFIRNLQRRTSQTPEAPEQPT